MRAGLVCVGLLTVVALTSCGEPPPLDMSLLTGEPCEPPCWQGLTPGESAEEDVAEFMRTTRFVDTRTVLRSTSTRLTRGGEEVAVISIEWDSTAGLGTCNSFSIEKSVLKYITICPDYDLTLERLIDRYGPPDKYRAILKGFERQWVDVTLFYPTHGFTVHFMLSRDDTAFEPEMQVGRVWYFRSAPLQRFLELRYEAGSGGPTPGKLLELLRDWPGYGAIEVD